MKFNIWIGTPRRVFSARAVTGERGQEDQGDEISTAIQPPASPPEITPPTPVSEPKKNVSAIVKLAWLGRDAGLLSERATAGKLARGTGIARQGVESFSKIMPAGRQ